MTDQSQQGTQERRPEEGFAQAVPGQPADPLRARWVGDAALVDGSPEPTEAVPTGKRIMPQARRADQQADGREVNPLVSAKAHAVREVDARRLSPRALEHARRRVVVEDLMTTEAPGAEKVLEQLLGPKWSEADGVSLARAAAEIMRPVAARAVAARLLLDLAVGAARALRYGAEPTVVAKAGDEILGAGGPSEEALLLSGRLDELPASMRRALMLEVLGPACRRVLRELETKMLGR